MAKHGGNPHPSYIAVPNKPKVYTALEEIGIDVPTTINSSRVAKMKQMFERIKEHGNIALALKQVGLSKYTVQRLMRSHPELREVTEAIVNDSRSARGEEFIGKVRAVCEKAFMSSDPKLLQAVSSHVRVVAEADGQIGQGRGGATVNVQQNVAIVGDNLVALMRKADEWEARNGTVEVKRDATQ
jgi:DNA-directed RNA polymerase subunit N (RpoN/RPB10)